VSCADRKRFLAQTLIPLSEGKGSHYQRFDWLEEALADWIFVKPEGLIIIEGVSVLGDDFNSYYNFGFYIPIEF